MFPVLPCGYIFLFPQLVFDTWYAYWIFILKYLLFSIFRSTKTEKIFFYIYAHTHTHTSMYNNIYEHSFSFFFFFLQKCLFLPYTHIFIPVLEHKYFRILSCVFMCIYIYACTCCGVWKFKDQKMVLDASLLTTKHYNVWIKGKWNNLGKGVAPSLTPRCSSYWKKRFRVSLNYGRPTHTHTHTHIYMYMKCLQ